jgi:hypothetical protein
LYSLNSVPDEKKREEASDVRDEMYLMISLEWKEEGDGLPGGNNGLAVSDDVVEEMGSGDTSGFGELVDVCDGLAHGVAELDVGEGAGVWVFELWDQISAQ